MAKKVQVDTKVTPDIKLGLEAAANALGVNRADVCRAAFKMYLEDFDSIIKGAKDEPSERDS